MSARRSSTPQRAQHTPCRAHPHKNSPQAAHHVGELSEIQPKECTAADRGAPAPRTVAGDAPRIAAGDCDCAIAADGAEHAEAAGEDATIADAAASCDEDEDDEEDDDDDEEDDEEAAGKADCGGGRASSDSGATDCGDAVDGDGGAVSAESAEGAGEGERPKRCAALASAGNSRAKCGICVWTYGNSAPKLSTSARE